MTKWRGGTMNADTHAHMLEALDEYEGPDAGRVEWLADQGTSAGDEFTDAEWDARLADAAAVVATWLALREARVPLDEAIADTKATAERHVSILRQNPIRGEAA